MGSVPCLSWGKSCLSGPPMSPPECSGLCLAVLHGAVSPPWIFTCFKEERAGFTTMGVLPTVNVFPRTACLFSPEGFVRAHSAFACPVAHTRTGTPPAHGPLASPRQRHPSPRIASAAVDPETASLERVRGVLGDTRPPRCTASKGTCSIPI